MLGQPTVESAAHLLGALLLAGCLAACVEPPFPIEYEGEHFRYGTGLDYPLCEGDLQHYDILAERTAAALGLPLASGAEVYIWKNHDWTPDLAAELCGGETSFGCYGYAKHTIYTSETALQHELVHAALGPMDTNALISEGIADAFAGTQSRFAQSLPSSNAHTTTYDTDRLTSDHFVHWLLDKWGAKKLGELLPKREGLLADFEAVYGVPLTEAELEYLAEAPAAYPALYSCEAPSFDFDAEFSTWSLDAELACADAGTRAIDRGLYTSRVWVVDEPGYYNIRIGSGRWIEASRCTEQPVETRLSFEEYAQLDIPPDHSGYPYGSARYIAGPVIETVELEPGRYLVRVGIEGFEPGRAELAIWPAPGPYAEVPGG